MTAIETARRILSTATPEERERLNGFTREWNRQVAEIMSATLVSKRMVDR